MRLRVRSLTWVLLLLLVCVSDLGRSAEGQIRVERSAKSNAQAHPNDLTPVMVDLYLCVDGASAYPCPNPLSSDMTYNEYITLDYGQILDGLVFVDANFGTLSLSANGTVFCTLRIGIDTACPSYSTIFDQGTYLILAKFHADSTYADATSLPVYVTVAKDSSMLTLKSSQNPSALGTPVTISAIATGGYPATPTGQVVFTVDGAALAPATIDATGTASFTTSTLALGTHTIEASYGGAKNFDAAPMPNALQQVVQPPATTTALSSDLNPSIFEENVTFTATVATAAGFTGMPTGAVTFKDGTTAFGTVLVTPKNGQNIAQTTISTLSVGSHSITAAYSGDAATSASVSPVLIQQVEYRLAMPPPGYTITVTPSPVAIGVGQTTYLTVTVTPLGGFDAPVALSCSGLPTEAACTFDEMTIPAGGGSTKMALSTMAPHDCGNNPPYFIGSAGLHMPGSPGRLAGYAAPLLAGIFLLALPRRRGRRWGIHWGKGLWVLIALCTALGLGGCSSHCTDFGTTPGDYTFKVNGTSSPATPVVTNGTPSGSGDINVTTSVALAVKL